MNDHFTIHSQVSQYRMEQQVLFANCRDTRVFPILVLDLVELDELN